MRVRIGFALTVFAASMAAVVSDPAAVAAQAKDKDKPTISIAGYDVLVRKGGAKDFDDKTPKIGIEIFLDEANGAELAISDTGAIAVIPAAPVGKERKAPWLYGQDLHVRKAGEVEFTQNTRKFGVEAFNEQSTNRLLYVSETSFVALAPMPAGLTKEKGPKLHHALEPKVRAPDETTFEKAKKFGIEIFKDENTGGLIYITETGSIAVAPAPATPPDKKNVKKPTPMYGLWVKVRKADEPNFGDKSRKLGIEAFGDPNTGGMFYLTDTGSIATARNPAQLKKLKEDEPAVTWQSATNLKIRNIGEKDFSKATKKYGIEVYRDNKTGYLLYVSETGSIAVLEK